ncbi:5-methylaminomethyl-2-thiouridine methyltransferase [Xaviernesmea oryzae]|uniref:5-methylaminomethyl-2-thiouridine methyltransferase n=1 Tax=Xaviernesmea oryzae TaxID=464029 RepID=A0A1Q9AVN7_9HYPH|nr:tRNA (5-methylaminomethyl-2-thiouridine)(34)-methyltransferase MnmD [Xaviernesmea oryzae]OLP59510.1 5-methylaminomethyl-2-thiouridine methyltransferase [Xaviernesmea oryzae]
MPYSREFSDHFYCRDDGRLECGHVFLSGNALPQRLAALDADACFSIGELGFGTGLNAMETWRQWKLSAPPGARLAFTSFERFPMPRAAIERALARWPELEAERLCLLSHWPDAPAGKMVLDLAPDMRLTVVCGVALERLAAETALFDAWYLDGFAPSRNGDMWSAELMAQVYAHTREGGRFATYAAAGFVRRNLIAAGFQVERRPGFAGKREMLCGQRAETAKTAG